LIFYFLEFWENTGVERGRTIDVGTTFQIRIVKHFGSPLFSYWPAWQNGKMVSFSTPLIFFLNE
jgi:hypothetical protein